jgi:hypothetical protein
MSLTPPVPIPSGQAVVWVIPTAAIAGPDISATNGSASYGVDANGDVDGTGLLTMTSSAPLANEHWTIIWSGFPAPTVPVNGSITHIYAVVDATRNISPNGYCEAYLSPSGGSIISPTLVAFSGEFHSGDLGTDPSILASLTLSARVFDTIHATFNTIYTINGVAFAVYYSAPILPIGHGANCNDYDPIAISDGSVTAPGNGLLIS